MTRRWNVAVAAASLALATLAASFSATPALAQPANAEQLCTPDVMRLCSDFIPDRERIIACMIRSKASLSPGCASVFATPEPEPVRTARASRKPAANARLARASAPRSAAAKPAKKPKAGVQMARNRPLDITRRR